MALANLYTLAQIDIDTAAVAGTIDQIISQEYSGNLARIIAAGDGAVDPNFVALGGAEPMFGFATTGIAKALALCGISGLRIDDDTDDPGLTAFFQNITTAGLRGGAGTHTTITCADGLLIPTSIQAGLDDLATMNLACHAAWDGMLEPFVLAGSASLIGTPSVSEGFVVGPASINGAALNGVLDFTFNFGLEIKKHRADGEVYPRRIWIGARNPSISVTVEGIDILASLGIDGAVQGATDSVFYLRKVEKGGTRVANATAEHISFTLDDGRVDVESVGGGQGETQTEKLTFTPAYDGLAAIVVIDETAAIA